MISIRGFETIETLGYFPRELIRAFSRSERIVGILDEVIPHPTYLD